MRRIKSTYECGDDVKGEFADGNAAESEWMWVRVEWSDDDTRLVFGRLDTQPVVQNGLKLGQQVAISYDKVREHRKRLVP